MEEKVKESRRRERKTGNGHRIFFFQTLDDENHEEGTTEGRGRTGQDGAGRGRGGCCDGREKISTVSTRRLSGPPQVTYGCRPRVPSNGSGQVIYGTTGAAATNDPAMTEAGTMWTEVTAEVSNK